MAALPAARLAKLIKAAVKDEYGIYFQKGNGNPLSLNQLISLLLLFPWV